jgi:hypothetical protein
MVIFNGLTCLPNFMKIQASTQTLLVGDTQTSWWFDKLTFIFGKQDKSVSFSILYINYPSKAIKLMLWTVVCR